MKKVYNNYICVIIIYMKTIIQKTKTRTDLSMTKEKIEALCKEAFSDPFVIKEIKILAKR